MKPPQSVATKENFFQLFHFYSKSVICIAKINFSIIYIDCTVTDSYAFTTSMQGIIMGSTAEAFEKHQGNITQIAEADLRARHLAVETIIGEASELVNSATEDISSFTKMARFEMDNIHSLQERIDAFMYSYALFQDVALDKSEAKELWDNVESEAYVAKRKLLKRLELIYDEDGRHDDLKQIKQIAIGRGRRDLTMDYLQLSEIAVKDAEHLASLNFGEADVARISEIFEILKSLIGSITTPKAEIEEKKLLMEQAYSYLDQSVSSIRKYGQLIFDGEDREKLYKSESHIEYGKMSHSTNN